MIRPALAEIIRGKVCSYLKLAKSKSKHVKTRLATAIPPKMDTPKDVTLPALATTPPRRRARHQRSQPVDSEDSKGLRGLNS